MQRNTLQLCNLVIWCAGLVLLIVALIVATHYGVDNYSIDCAVITKFRNRAGSELAAPAVDLIVGKLITAGDEPTIPRTKAGFENWLDVQLGGSRPQWMLENIAGHACGNKVWPLFRRVFEIYFPWLALMITGALLERNGKRLVDRHKAILAIFLSGGLQLGFLASLVGSLAVGDLKATVDLQWIVVLVAGVVGVLVQFVFPAAKTD